MPKTMKDIARDLGVSVSTVSRALMDSPRISAVQKERIQQYAREYNFCPNMIGEALRHSKVKPMKVIGVILPEWYIISLCLSSPVLRKKPARADTVLWWLRATNVMKRRWPSAMISTRTRCVVSLCRKRKIQSSMVIFRN